MGAQPLAPMAQDGDDATAAVAVEAITQDAKRHKRVHERPSLDAGSVASHGEEDLDASQPDWWKPQPHATLDANELQDRPYGPLAASLSCALCRGLLREAMTAPECGHTYCYDCVEGRVEIGGNHNVCPVAGCGTVLGPNPFDHHRLVYDTLLDTLVRKIFPRPELDAALAARRAEREEATRQARAEVNGPGGRGQHNQHHHHNTKQQHPKQEHEQPQGRGGAKQQQQRLSSPRGGRGGGGRGGGGGSGGVRGIGSPDGGEEGDDEGSDPEPGRLGHGRRHHIGATGSRRHR